MIAVDSPDGDRLCAIAQEHAKLAKYYAIEYFKLSHADHLQIASRIKDLQTERDTILSKFEGVGA